MATIRTTTNAVLAIGDGNTSELFDIIAEVENIGDIGSTTNMHRTDSHSLGTPWGRQIPGLQMQKDVQVKVWFDPNDPQHTFTAAGGLGYIKENRVLKNYLFYYPNLPLKAEIWAAYISDVSQPVPVDGVMEMTVTFARTGPPERVDATSLLNS